MSDSTVPAISTQSYGRKTIFYVRYRQTLSILITHLNSEIILDYVYLFSSYRAVNNVRLGYKNQSVNVV
jgi:hypothetical protein